MSSLLTLGICQKNELGPLDPGSDVCGVKVLEPNYRSEEDNFSFIVRFKEVFWENLKPGEKIYYYIMGQKKKRIHGPFKVVDPKNFQLKNSQGVKLRISNVQPLKIEN